MAIQVFDIEENAVFPEDVRSRGGKYDPLVPLLASTSVGQTRSFKVPGGEKDGSAVRSFISRFGKEHGSKWRSAFKLESDKVHVWATKLSQESAPENQPESPPAPPAPQPAQ